MKICVLGEDKRSLSLRNILNSCSTNIDEADCIVTPIPFTKDGVYISGERLKIVDLIDMLSKSNKILISGSINEESRKKMKEKNICFYDLMNFEEFSIMNAIATSEGAIKKAIEMTDFTLNNSNILILGYGRIGKILANNLSGFGAKIYCEARKKKDIALIKSMGYNDIDLSNLDTFLPDMDIIFNTIPHMILDKRRIELLKSNVCVIDLASKPGGVDFEYASQRKVNLCWYLTIPSKDSPYSAAMYIKDIIYDILGEEDIWEKK